MIRVSLPARDAEWLIAHLTDVSRDGTDHDAAHADAVLAALGVWHRPPAPPRGGRGRTTGRRAGLTVVPSA